MIKKGPPKRQQKGTQDSHTRTDQKRQPKQSQKASKCCKKHQKAAKGINKEQQAAKGIAASYSCLREVLQSHLHYSSGLELWTLFRLENAQQ